MSLQADTADSFSRRVPSGLAPFRSVGDAFTRAPVASYLTLALVLHLWAAVFSVGYYHHDEHQQILEPVAVKLGLNTAARLPWEFAAQIRPWLQISVFYGIARGARALGLENPFSLALLFRLVSAVLGWASLAGLAHSAKRWLPDGRDYRLFLGITALLWFLPFLHARTSSENWGGALFFLGVAALTLGPSRLRSRALLAGFLWGLSFQCRYQMAFCIAGAGLWYLAHARQRLAGLALGFAMATVVGALADYWGYGAWTFPAWRYFVVNLVEHRASAFGVSPWWSYLTNVAAFGVPPISLLLIVGTALTWVFRPRHVITWATLPFLVGHSLIGHKELRFLFPLASAAPLLLTLPLEGVRRLEPSVRWALKPLLVLNLLLLAWMSTITPTNELILLRRLYAVAPTVVYYRNFNPCYLATNWSRFYLPVGLTCEELRDVDTLGDAWVIEKTRGATTLPPRCTTEASTRPPLPGGALIEWLLEKTRFQVIGLYHCR